MTFPRCRRRLSRHARALLRAIARWRPEMSIECASAVFEHVFVRLVDVIPRKLALFDLSFQVGNGRIWSSGSVMVYRTRRTRCSSSTVPITIELNLDRERSLVRCGRRARDMRETFAFNRHEAETLVADCAHCTPTPVLPFRDLVERAAALVLSPPQDPVEVITMSRRSADRPLTTMMTVFGWHARDGAMRAPLRRDAKRAELLDFSS